ncbi:ABC transporter permease subunit [Natrinema salifodinae]|uniref:ABC-2 type transport system permease protein n=1 Tax=Natrinema salifodinae TaxID=1202768 RepID=A0A1I0PCX8_9EURY|nr:ABC transporter permease subunit [Natrinema salifodinae]SEW12067.1 ABC-2 type transport system permease protein [Natrinema salifodinae]
MFELTRYDGRRRIRGSLYLSVGLSLLAAMVIWVYPSFQAEVDLDQLLAAYPEPILQVMGVQTMASLGGFLAFELYTFGWIILLGLYLAYSTAGTIADDVDRGRMDVLLAMPLSRTRLVGERFAAMVVPIVVANLLPPIVVYVGAELIDESLSAADVLAVHLLSIPYLFACAGIGLVASVAVDRAGIAQRVALGVTFALFLSESLLSGTDAEAVGAIAPMRYYDPNEVLLEGTYDLAGAGILAAMTVVLLVASQLWFRRRDIG